MRAISLTCLLLTLLLASKPAAGQAIDQRQAGSLLTVWHDTTRVDTARFDALYELLWCTSHTLTPDSTVRVCEQLFALANKHDRKAE